MPFTGGPEMRNLRSYLPLIALAAILMTLAAAPATADEILDQIEQAIAMYQDGDYAGAAGELEFAAAQIRQLRAGEISAALPGPLSGWTAQDAETAAMGSGFLGGGTSASRRYEQGDAHVQVQILTDSPMLQSMAMLINNPMLLSGSGQKLVRVKGHKGALEWNEDSGSLNVVVGGNVLVQIDGSQCSRDDLTAYAEAVDYDLIEKLMSN